MQYRKEIDGLRAIAVISVFLFHLKFGFFSGGYVGVDIFFVISGYLITEIIRKKLIDGTFSFLEFYERRLRRIIPAFFLVVIFTQVFTYIFFLPLELVDYSKSLLASLFFYSNIHFWQLDPYFDSRNEDAPLLNIWSLSIEEQFYFLYPLFLFLIFKFCKNSKLFIYLSLFFLSCACSIWITRMDQNSGFYLPYLRAWELMIGGLVSWNVFPIFKQQLKNNLFILIGFILIFISIFNYTNLTQFPGIYAICPCLGTALIIHFTKGESSYFKDLLGCKIATFLGKISYSLYLWHWPIIVFVQYYMMQNLSLTQKYILIFGVISLSYFTYKYVEMPARNKIGIFKSNKLFIVMILCTLTISAVIAYRSVYVDWGMPRRFSAKIQKYANGARDIRPDKKTCFYLEDNKNTDICTIGKNPTKKPSFLIYGDSYAHTIIPAFEFLADKNNVVGLASAVSDCRPSLGVYSSDKFRDYIPCADFNSEMLKLVKDNNIKHVVLFAMWPQRFIKRSVSDDRPNRNADSVTFGLDNLLSYFEKQNVKVWIIGKIYKPSFDVPSYLARHEMFNRDSSTLVRNKNFFFSRQDFEFQKVLDVLRQKHSFEFIDIASILCNDDCLLEIDGNPMYSDKSHLSYFAIMRIKHAFNHFFETISKE